MRVIIDIPKEAFDYIKDSNRLGWITDNELTEVIAKGKPLLNFIEEVDKLPRIKVGNSNSPTVKYCIDEKLVYDLFECL